MLARVYVTKKATRQQFLWDADGFCYLGSGANFYSFG